jgi:hypothetical protein
MNAPDGDAHARREGQRIAHVIVIVVAVVFIGASAAQIIPAVFGAGIRPLSPGEAGSPEDECAHGVRSLALALDRASAQAWSPSLEQDRPLDLGIETARLPFQRGLLPDRNVEANIEQACAKTSVGLDAWAALQRLRTADEQIILRGFGELVPARRDVMAHLPANLR